MSDADVLVRVEDRFSPAGFQRHCHNLGLEAALGDRVRRALMRLHRQFVLLQAGNLMAFSQVFRGLTHVDIVERVVQGGGHHVDHAGVAHSRAPAHPRRQIASAAHAFRPAGDGDVGVTEGDRLGGGDDRLKTGAAQPVQSQGWRVLGDTGVERGDAGQVHVLRLGVDDVAEDNMLHLVAGDIGA